MANYTTTGVSQHF